MKMNESNLDRIIRVAVALILLYLGFGGVLSGVTAIIADVLGVILLLTSAIGFCPLYTLLKINTLKK